MEEGGNNFYIEGITWKRCGGRGRQFLQGGILEKVSRGRD